MMIKVVGYFADARRFVVLALILLRDFGLVCFLLMKFSGFRGI